MIGLLIQDNAYEQDIRELLMSFYPGETYAHEVKEGVDFYVQTRLEDGEAVIGIWEKMENGKLKNKTILLYLSIFHFQSSIQKFFNDFRDHTSFGFSG